MARRPHAGSRVLSLTRLLVDRVARRARRVPAPGLERVSACSRIGGVERRPAGPRQARSRSELSPATPRNAGRRRLRACLVSPAESASMASSAGGPVRPAWRTGPVRSSSRVAPPRPPRCLSARGRPLDPRPRPAQVRWRIDALRAHRDASPDRMPGPLDPAAERTARSSSVSPAVRSSWSGGRGYGYSGTTRPPPNGSRNGRAAGPEATRYMPVGERRVSCSP
jgi:hypothetical protein